MRPIALLSGLIALLCGSSLFLPAADRAYAGPGAIALPVASPGAVPKVGWRRYCRRYGCDPEVVLPGAEVIPEAGADIDAEGEIETDVPAVVVLPPPRPLSCGQYRYWDGSACVDARYTDPYLGPR